MGYQFLCCYSFLGIIFQIFLLSLLDDSDNSCHFQPFKTLLMSLLLGKTPFASSQIHQNPNSNFSNLNMSFVITKDPSFLLICWSSKSSQRSSYPFKPWICKNIAKSYAIFFICDLFLFLSFWGIKSKGIACHLLNSWKFEEMIFVPNLSSGKNIDHF